MAFALINGFLKSRILKEEELFVSDTSEEALAKLKADKPGIHTSRDNCAFLACLDYLVLAVKPHVYKTVIKEIRNKLPQKTVVITIAAGQSMAEVRSLFQRDVKLVRTMPNTPALIGEGMTAICPGEEISHEEKARLITLFSSTGGVELLDEKLFDAHTALSGSGPAYVFMFIEALADGAVREGLPRDKAYAMAARMVAGSARMVLETGRHPGSLKDQVCSPGGTTIEAVGLLEEKGFRSAVMEALRVCAEKSRNLSETGKGKGTQEQGRPK